VTQQISTAHNTEKHWRNLVRADAKQVANCITTDEDDDDVDTNEEDKDEDSDTNDDLRSK
jgi:hypothetical protein